jgi:hypothetical protein
MEPGAVPKLQRQRIMRIELLINLPIFFSIIVSICGFEGGLASSCLWDLVGAFWDPLIFLCQGSWSPLGCRNVFILSCSLLEIVNVI